MIRNRNAKLIYWGVAHKPKHPSDHSFPPQFCSDQLHSDRYFWVEPSIRNVTSTSFFLSHVLFVLHYLAWSLLNYIVCHALNKSTLNSTFILIGWWYLIPSGICSGFKYKEKCIYIHTHVHICYYLATSSQLVYELQKGCSFTEDRQNRQSAKGFSCIWEEIFQADVWKNLSNLDVSVKSWASLRTKNKILISPHF